MNNNSSPPKFDRSDLMALLAVLISLGAFGVSVYETRILKEQAVLMQDQQKVSVWPYVEEGANFSYTINGIEMSYAIVNKGVGPARISHSSILINGDPIKNYQDVIEAYKKFLPPETEFSISFGDLSGVLSPNEELIFLEIAGPRFPDDIQKLNEAKLTFEVCYCSIYDDCWTITEVKEEPSEGCNVK